METSIVHLSDLHFKNDVENRFRIERLRDDIAALPLGPNVVTAFTGDLVQSGDQEQYDVLFDLLLGPMIEANHQIAIVPGNHDVERQLTDSESAAAFIKDKNRTVIKYSADNLGAASASIINGVPAVAVVSEESWQGEKTQPAP